MSIQVLCSVLISTLLLLFERQRDVCHLLVHFSYVMSQIKARRLNSINVFHGGGRNPRTWTIIYYIPGCALAGSWNWEQSRFWQILDAGVPCGILIKIQLPHTSNLFEKSFVLWYVLYKYYHFIGYLFILLVISFALQNLFFWYSLTWPFCFLFPILLLLTALLVIKLNYNQTNETFS